MARFFGELGHSVREIFSGKEAEKNIMLQQIDLEIAETQRKIRNQEKYGIRVATASSLGREARPDVLSSAVIKRENKPNQQRLEFLNGLRAEVESGKIANVEALRKRLGIVYAREGKEIEEEEAA
jgi:hypothetical protein